MSLEKKYVELNKKAEEFVNAISAINERYLSNDIQYPYDEVKMLMDKYDVVYKRLLKKKNSVINRWLSKISVKKRVLLKKLVAPDKYEICGLAGEKVIPQILAIFDEYKLTEESMDGIKDKLLPVVKSLNIGKLVDLYKKCKKCDKILRNGNALAYLQEIYVEFVIANILHDHAIKGVNSGVVWTYKEIVNNFFEEDVYKFRKVAKK